HRYGAFRSGAGSRLAARPVAGVRLRRADRGHADPARGRVGSERRTGGPAHRASVLPARRDAGAAPRPPGSDVVTPYAAVAKFADPELRVATIEDLGILRSVSRSEGGRVTVTITPTYSGCPAMDAIRSDVTRALREAGFLDALVETVLSPAWTT